MAGSVTTRVNTGTVNKVRDASDKEPSMPQEELKQSLASLHSELARNPSVDPELRQSVLAYVLIILLLFGAGTGILMLLETEAKIDITTAATASAATLNNIGPGLARVGAIENFAWFTAPSKAVMSVLMALGRLEVFAILVLFMPRFWKGD